jgi:hypothetical protein
VRTRWQCVQRLFQPESLLWPKPRRPQLHSKGAGYRRNQSSTASFTWTVSNSVQGTSPSIVSSRGYINGTPLTAHSTTAFNSVGAPSWWLLYPPIRPGTGCR